MENSSKAIVILYAAVVVAFIAYLYLSLKNNKAHDMIMESEMRDRNETLGDILEKATDNENFFNTRFDKLELAVAGKQARRK